MIGDILPRTVSTIAVWPHHVTHISHSLFQACQYCAHLCSHRLNALRHQQRRPQHASGRSTKWGRWLNSNMSLRRPRHLERPSGCHFWWRKTWQTHPHSFNIPQWFWRLACRPRSGASSRTVSNSMMAQRHKTPSQLRTAGLSHTEEPHPLHHLETWLRFWQPFTDHRRGEWPARDTCDISAVDTTNIRSWTRDRSATYHMIVVGSQFLTTTDELWATSRSHIQLDGSRNVYLDTPHWTAGDTVRQPPLTCPWGADAQSWDSGCALTAAWWSCWTSQIRKERQIGHSSAWGPKTPSTSSRTSHVGEFQDLRAASPDGATFRLCPRHRRTFLETPRSPNTHHTTCSLGQWHDLGRLGLQPAWHRCHPAEDWRLSGWQRCRDRGPESRHPGWYLVTGHCHQMIRETTALNQASRSGPTMDFYALLAGGSRITFGCILVTRYTVTGWWVGASERNKTLDVDGGSKYIEGRNILCDRTLCA